MFDGTNVWVADDFAGTLLRPDAPPALILQTVTAVEPRAGFRRGEHLGAQFPLNSVSVFAPPPARSSARSPATTCPAPAAASTGNASRDERDALDGVSLWKAADLTSLGSSRRSVFALRRPQRRELWLAPGHQHDRAIPMLPRAGYRA
jgi:hypothetical protein